MNNAQTTAPGGTPAVPLAGSPDNPKKRAVYVALIGAVAVFAVMAAQSYRSVDRELTEAALARRLAVASLAAATLSEKLDRLVGLGVSLAGRVLLPELIPAEKWDEAVGIMQNALTDFGDIDRVFLADVKGTLMADIPALGGGVRGKDFSDRDWYRGVSREWKPYVSPVYLRAAIPQQNVFAVAVPVRDREQRVLAILVLQMRIEAFFGWARKLDIGPGAFVYVVDSKGQAAFHPALRARTEIPDLSRGALVRRLLQGSSGIEIGTDPIGGSESVSAFAPARHGWGVVTEQGAGEAFSFRDDQLRRVLTGYASLLLIGIAAIYLAVRLVAQHRRAAEGERHKAELERQVHERTGQLEAANRELEDLYDNAPCGYHSVDADGKFVRMNQTWLGWLGYRREEVLGKLRHPDIMTPRSAELFHAKWFPLFRRQGWLKEVEFEYVRKDGSTFPALVSGSSIHDKGGNFVMSRSTVFDISVRKRIERDMRELNVQLKSTNKELESFSYSVSHDLRAPLRAIDGYALMLQEDFAPRLDDEGRRLLGVVREEATHMGQLIDDLLQFSRTGRKAIEAAAIDMGKLAREVAAELKVGHPGATVEIAELPQAVGDRSLLKQVWMNLVGNALKYSANAESPRIEIGGRAEGAECEYWVRDNGVGFDMRYADKLFGVFQRLHRAEEFPGTGVGLAIVQRVVARHGGRVSAEGSVDGGARFGFALPSGG